MVTVIIQHEVRDFDTWLSHFNNHSAERKENGSMGAEVFQGADNPNSITAILKWENQESLGKFMESRDLKAAMEEAGVTSPPTITVLTHAGSYDK